MSDDLQPYTGHDIALPSDGGAVSIPDYSSVPATVRDSYPSPYGGGDHHAPAPYQPGPGATGPQAFGVPLPAGISPARMQAEFAVIADVFRNDMVKLNIPANLAEIAADWFQTAAAMPPPKEPVRHSYRANLSAFSPADRAYANQFLNLMAHAGAPQGVIDRMLGWYHKLDRLGTTNVPTTKRTHITAADEEVALERCDRDRDACEAYLRSVWGHSFDSNIAVVANHVRNMRADLREHLERAVYPDGKLGLNDPEIILRLFDEANGGTPTDLAAAIQELEHVMRTDPRRYYRDERMQARLRHLYALRGH